MGLEWGKEKEIEARPSGLGVMRATCMRCKTVKFIAMDKPMIETRSWCKNPACQFERKMRNDANEPMHSCEVYMPPSLEADEFIKKENLNPAPKYGIPPRPWEMVTS